jgi:ribonuclease-3
MSEVNQPSREPPREGGAPVADPVDTLEARLGIALPDRALALAALTHKSYVNEHREEGLQDNERLEFLGDAVIDLAVSHRLMERFPAAREGDLSKMRAAVVDEQGLSEMARALDLGALLRLGRGEELTGGRAKASLLADAMEAVVAAIYVAGGLGAVLAMIDRFLGEAFARAAAGTLDRDYKTQLQELAQSKLRATPRYRVVAEHGPDHSKTFEVETELRGEVVGRGSGRSKKDAEQAAAKLALDALGRRLAEEEVEPAARAAAAAPAPPPAPAQPALDQPPRAEAVALAAGGAPAPAPEPRGAAEEAPSPGRVDEASEAKRKRTPRPPRPKAKRVGAKAPAKPAAKRRAPGRAAPARKGGRRTKR